MARIYLSSTYSDLKSYREAVYHSLRRMQYDVIAMEDYVATDQRPLDKCLNDVATCDLYVGVFAWRYGYIPAERNPELKSITELEYRKAVETGKSRLIFLLDEDAAWSVKLIDMHTGDGGGGAHIRSLRQELQKQELVSFFQSIEDLAGLVSQAVHNWEIHHATKDIMLLHGASHTKYLENMHKRYNTVTLPLGPAEGFSLHAIFQPLTLRSDPLAAEDLDRKQRKALLGESSDKSAHLFSELLKQRSSAGEVLSSQLGSVEQGTPSSQFEVIAKKEPEEETQSPQQVIAENGEDAIRRSLHGRIVILGGPGTGKTTTLKYLVGRRSQEALINSEAAIPIFLSLTDLARSGKSLLRYLTDLVEDMGLESEYAEMLWEEIGHGRAFVCLDSLDEVNPQQRPRIIELINSWATNSGGTWVIGSRFTEYKGGQFKQGQFIEWELLPMNQNLRLELAQRLFPEIQRLLSTTKVVSLSPSSFVTMLEQHPQAAAWAENPLLFSLAAVVFVQTGGLPTSRVTLYREVIEAVLKSREPDLVWYRLLWRVLSELALWLHQTRGRTFSMEDLLSFLMDIHGKSWEETANLAHRIITTGIMEVVARDTYGFRHQTFQEYLAAAELARRLTSQNAALREDAWKLAQSKHTYSRWTEVLRLMVGVLAQTTGTTGISAALRWLRMLAEQRTMPEGDPGSLGLTLALRSLVEVNEKAERGTAKIVAVEENIVSAWIDALLEAARQKRTMRSEQLVALAQDVRHLYVSGINRSLKSLVAAINDRDKEVQLIAMQALYILEERFPLEPVLEALNSEDKYMRRIAMRVLSTQKARLPLDLVLEALHDEDEYIRIVVLETLQTLRESVPLEPLLAALEDKSSDVRHAAMDAVKARGEQVSCALLFELLNHYDWYVRYVAAETLRADAERVPLDMLLEALSNRNVHTRYTAVQLLGNKEELISFKPLLERLHDSSDRVRDATIGALIKHSQRVPLQPLLEKLHDEDKSVRQAAVNVLKWCGERVPLDPLLERLHDSDANVRQAAIGVLIAFKERVPLDPLLERLHDSDANVRRATIEALKAFEERVPLDPLLAALQDKSEDVRRAAIEVLITFGDHAPLDPLLERLHDSDTNVRRAAIEALKAFGERVPLDPLLAALQDKSEDVRRAAIEVLITRIAEVPFELLLAALPSTKGPVQLSRRGQLGQASSTQSIHASHSSHVSSHMHQVITEALRMQIERVPIRLILIALKNEDENLRQAAAEALKSQGEQIPLEALFGFLNDQDEAIRQAAVEALVLQRERLSITNFVSALQDEDITVFRLTVQVLRVAGEHIALDRLLTALQNNYWLTRQAAVEVLAAQHGQASLAVLLTALQDEDKRVRLAAIEALKVRAEHIPLEPLLTALDDKEGDVRCSALQALGEQGERVPLEPLLATLYDEDEKVRQAAITALKAQGQRVPLKPLFAALQDKNKSVQQAAIEVLKVQGERIKLQPLLAALASNDENVRLTALQLLEGQAGNVPLDPLLAALHDTNGAIRSAAISVLGARGGDISPEPLITALSDRDSTVRKAAVEALKSQRRNIPYSVLFDEDKNVLLAVLEALKKHGEDVPFDDLFVALRDKNEEVRQAVVAVFKVQGQRVPLKPLFAALRDEDKNVRQAAVEVLKAQGERIPIDPLLEALGDRDTQVRLIALQVLEGNAKRVPLDVLLVALNDKNAAMRQAALKVFVARDEYIPLDPLLSALSDEDKVVRRVAVEAIGAQGNHEATQFLLAMLGDEDGDVRRTALQVVKQVSPDVLLTVVPEAIAILQRQSPGTILGSLTQSFIADLIGQIKYSTPVLVETLTKLLDWPYWQVQVKAAHALGELRRNILDTAIRRLLELRRDQDPKMRVVREAADDALAEILSLETGIEDD